MTRGASSCFLRLFVGCKTDNDSSRSGRFREVLTLKRNKTENRPGKGHSGPFNDVRAYGAPRSSTRVVDVRARLRRSLLKLQRNRLTTLKFYLSEKICGWPR